MNPIPRRGDPHPSRMSRFPRWRSRSHSSHGQALVEFALILPVLLLMLVIAIDFGRLFFSYIEINNAAREGAAYGLREPTDIVTITSRARQETNAQAQRGENAITVTTTCATGSGTAIDCSLATGGAGPGNRLTVNVNEPFTFLTPLMSGFFGGNLQLNASATSVVTDYAPSGAGTPPATCAAPVATFSVVVTSGLTIFANPSASTPNSGVCAISGFNWKWDPDPLNDSVGTATGDSHTYLAAGTYSITLTVTNQGGPATAIRSITVSSIPPPPTCAKPTANFTFTTTGNGSNKIYTYRDSSTVADSVNCPITDWLWTFAGGLQSNSPNPAPFSYGNASNHPVTLMVTNAGGSRSVTKDS